MVSLKNKSVHPLTRKELEEYLYATDKAIYEQFFKQSEELTKSYHVFGKVTYSQHCQLNCEFCWFRKENPFAKNTLSKGQFENKLKLAEKMGLDGVIIESGVLNGDGYSAFLEIISELRPMANIPIYFDIGSESLLSHPDILHHGKHFFIDYSPCNPEFRKSLKVFDKQNEMTMLIESFSSHYFYGNLLIDAPGQDFSELLDDIFYLMNLPLVGVKISPFVPIENTTYSIFASACLLTTLKIISLIRLLKPSWVIFIESRIHQLEYRNAMKMAMKIGGDSQIISLE